MYVLSGSLRGKQIYQLSAELVGGVKHVLAICNSGLPINKVKMTAYIFLTEIITYVVD